MQYSVQVNLKFAFFSNSFLHCNIIVHVHVGVWEYIESTRDKVRDLEQRVRLAKANVEQMHTIMNGWSQSPLFRRKEDKKDTLLNLEVTPCTMWWHICTL